MHLRARGPATILRGIAAGPVCTRRTLRRNQPAYLFWSTQRMGSFLVDREHRARGMVRHVVCRRSECFEHVMFWEADDQEICMLALGCLNDPGHLASVD